MKAEIEAQMKTQIKRSFEMITWQFLKLFLSNRTQNASALLAPAFPNHPLLLSDHSETISIHLTWRNYFHILFSSTEILYATYEIHLPRRFPPSCAATTPFYAATTPSYSAVPPSNAATTPPS